MITASRDVERDLISKCGSVIGMDEVGRGALAGPVVVGAALVDEATGNAPEGLTDSKLLTARRRAALCEPVRQWVRTSSVGWASSEEIDQWGIIAALRMAGRRALACIAEGGFPVECVLLDGSYDWLSLPAPDLFSVDTSTFSVTEGPCHLPEFPVVTHVKADLNCAVVSAASVLAKVERDAWMTSVEDPGYAWARNKGYSSPDHLRGLAELGPSDLHRKSWHLPGVPPEHSP